MSSPFDLEDTDTYLRWREHRLTHAIVASNELIVEVADPLHVTQAERAALLNRCQRSNMAIYASHVEMDEIMLRAFGEQFGLFDLDANWLADKYGISRITVSNPDNQRQTYIPYTDRAIKWHTDGYYNPPARQIRGMVLHCVRNAGTGGENRVMDHEIAYILLRDANPDFIRALSAPDVMTIPARVDEFDGVREAQTGPVFSIDAQGNLHMRYTARTRSIEWKQDALTLAAVAALENILDANSPHIHQLKMESGMGLLCSNVLHDRSSFTDDPTNPRLLFRARYLNRVVTA
ncbi:MAG: TauD/TfdA family dioxygenase [Sideroxydans sp.]|nr:TauD/TfdA family dioxygenase [Sideroxydans sp.]